MAKTIAVEPPTAGLGNLFNKFANSLKGRQKILQRRSNQ